MGYTHYFPHKAVTKAVWKKILADCKKLYEHMPEGVYLDGCSRGRAASRAYDGTGPMIDYGPIFSDDEIWFNGTDPDFGDQEGYPDFAHETFTLFRKGSGGFCFCKTARKPYDVMVTACLLVYKHHSPGTIELGSDGNAGEWAEAIQFVGEVLHYVADPFMDEEELDQLTQQLMAEEIPVISTALSDMMDIACADSDEVPMSGTYDDAMAHHLNQAGS